MPCLALPGSFRTDSSNLKLLQYLKKNYPELELEISCIAKDLGLFNSLIEKGSPNESLEYLLDEIRKAESILICTPEYLHSMPAVLKNMFEWCHQYDALAGKKIVPVCYTPAPPRGEKAMQSLLWTLDALNAYIPGSLIIHHTDISFDTKGDLKWNKTPELMDTLIELLMA